MAFADPQSITVNAVAQSMPRVKTADARSEYLKADGSLKLTISHQDLKNRFRRMARVDQRVVAADPLSSENEYKNLGVYLVVDQPEYGFTAAEINYVVQALCVWLTTANVTKMLGNEH
jgi:hypothetical protein